MTLTTQNIEALGSQISDMLPRINLIQHLSNSLLPAKDADTNTHLLQQCMSEGLTAIYDATEQLYQELDDIAYLLLNCNNDRELEAFRKNNTRLTRNMTEMLNDRLLDLQRLDSNFFEVDKVYQRALREKNGHLLGLTRVYHLGRVTGVRMERQRRKDND